MDQYTNISSIHVCTFEEKKMLPSICGLFKEDWTVAEEILLGLAMMICCSEVGIVVLLTTTAVGAALVTGTWSDV